MSGTYVNGWSMYRVSINPKGFQIFFQMLSMSENYPFSFRLITTLRFLNPSDWQSLTTNLCSYISSPGVMLELCQTSRQWWGEQYETRSGKERKHWQKIRHKFLKKWLKPGKTTFRHFNILHCLGNCLLVLCHASVWNSIYFQSWGRSARKTMRNQFQPDWSRGRKSSAVTPACSPKELTASSAVAQKRGSHSFLFLKNMWHFWSSVLTA